MVVRLLLCALALGGGPSVRLPSPETPRGAFEALGLDLSTLKGLALDPSTAAAIFRVTTVGPGDRPSLFGSYRVEGETLRFLPKYPIEPGVTYRAVLMPPGHPTPILAELAVPERRVISSTKVTRVSPTAGVLPENLLKFYVEFSAPMGRGGAYEHLTLLNGQGKPIDLPFLELGEELWAPGGRRFTILFDPGRIKSGLRPREEAGPVLEAGQSYTLVIDQAWRDASGAPLVSSFRKAFRVGPADHEPPDPALWGIEPPEPGARKPLVVTFPEPLDRAMLARVLGVSGPRGEGIPGTVSVSDDERGWSFEPEQAWKSGEYRLLVDRSLEDRAGNTIGRPFEVDVFETVDRVTTPEIVSRSFRVGR